MSADELDISSISNWNFQLDGLAEREEQPRTINVVKTSRKMMS
jgi:hypothetical protein